MSIFRRRRQSSVAEDELDEIDQRGWDAVTAAAESLYPGTKELHVAFHPGVHFGSPLQGASAYPGDSHWFYISYGLTELWDKKSDDPDVSGFGYELTLRVQRGDEPQAPGWPFDILGSLARYARSGPQELWLGDRIDLQRPLDGDPLCPLTTVAVTPDVRLEPVATPNGRVEFRQLVGLSPDEVARAKRSSTAELLAERAGHDPLLVTDPRP